MAHILILTSDLASIVNSHAEVARRLRVDGHEVTHLRTGEEIHDLQGRAWEVLDRARPAGGRGRAARAEAIERLGLEDHRRRMLDRSPDLVLADIERHEQVAVALTLGVPVALTSSWITPGHVRGQPPLDRLDPAPTDARDRLRNELVWLRRRITTQRPRLQAIVRSRGADRHAVLSAFTRRHGVSYRRVTTTDAWLRPWGYRRLPILVLAPAEIEMAPDPDVTYLGAMVGPPGDTDLPDAVAEAIDRHRAGPDPGPLVFCSFGSFAVSYEGGLLGEVLRAAHERPDWTLLLALGGTRDPADLGELPANVVAQRWMPQRRVLEEVDVAITHAGPMTIFECVLGGVPTVVYSAGLRDQDGDAARVAHHHLGMLGRRDDAAPVIRDRVARVLTDPAIESGVAEMRRALLRDDRVLERTVEGLLAGSGSM